MTVKKSPLDRLNYSGEIALVIDRICSIYGVGKPKSFFVIGTGYEDCNLIIETSDSKYVAKIFSKERDQETIRRYIAIMKKAVEARVNHPTLIKTIDGEVVYSDSQANGISMVLMKFIDGQTFFEIDSVPNAKERQAVIEEATKINRIDYCPSYFFDSWAIPNIKVMFEKVKKFIEPDDIKLVEQVIRQYGEIPVEELPHCFVHGDLRKTNVMKGNDGKIYILDFSVSNWYPRIQEIAVIAANLFHEENEVLSLRDRVKMVSDEYNRLSPLTADERRHLYAYTLAGVAMELIGAHQEFINGNDTEETKYWLNLGRNELRKELII